MVGLEHLVVKQLVFLITPIVKPFDQILAAVRHLPKLKRLEMHAINGKENFSFLKVRNKISM